MGWMSAGLMNWRAISDRAGKHLAETQLFGVGEEILEMPGADLSLVQRGMSLNEDRVSTQE
jgi:hypothetical protein